MVRSFYPRRRARPQLPFTGRIGRSRRSSRFWPGASTEFCTHAGMIRPSLPEMLENALLQRAVGDLLFHTRNDFAPATGRCHDTADYRSSTGGSAIAAKASRRSSSRSSSLGVLPAATPDG